MVMLQDPSIKQMAEQIANDPAFAQMQQALQASVTGGAAPGEAAGAGTSRAAEAGSAPEIPGIDPEQYASAMSKVLQNQNFMEMAEKLGQQIMTVCAPLLCVIYLGDTRYLGPDQRDKSKIFIWGHFHTTSSNEKILLTSASLSFGVAGPWHGIHDADDARPHIPHQA